MNSGRQAGNGEHGDIVLLAKIDCGFHGFLCGGSVSEQLIHPLKAKEFSGGAGCLQQSICVYAELIAGLQFQDRFGVIGVTNQPQGTPIPTTGRRST